MGRKAASARSKGVIAIWVTVAALLLPLPALAQSNWQGDVSTSWTDAGNWSAGIPSATGAVINGGSPYNPVIASGANTTTWLTLGSAAGQSGALSITGGTLAVNGTLPTDSFYNTVIGDRGSGTLTVSGGGQLNGSYAYLGLNLPATAGDPRSSGTATITGTGSQWSLRSLDIGSSGTGTMTVEQGGALIATGAIKLGNDTGASGTLDVLSGGSVSAFSVSIAAVNAGSGAVTVDGAGSILTGTGSITVGSGTTGDVNGTLDITDGGKAVTAGLTVGARGTVTLDGEDSAIEAGFVTVGSIDGLAVTDGGTITATGKGTVFGSASLAGGSSWSMGSTLTVSGTGDAGVLTISSGSQVSAVTAALSGSGTSGRITADGTGSTLTVTGKFEAAVFSGATATLEATNGGQINLDQLVQTQTGTFTVSGAGSKLTVSDRGQFGGSGGTTTVNVSDGGTVVTGIIANETAPITPTPTMFGAVAGGTTNATITGEGSSWTNYGVMMVGDDGTATLDIEDGASLYSTRMTVAGSGQGTLTISGGAEVETQRLTIASDSTSSTGNGTVTVTGAGSKLSVTQALNHIATLEVGAYGAGRLEILDGGVVEAAWVDIAGGNANGSGSILVSGTGSQLTSTGIDVGVFRSASLTIEDGGRVDATGAIGVGKGTELVPGNITVDNGTLTTADYINLDAVSTLVARNGATIESAAAQVGQSSGSVASVTLTGEGTSWAITSTPGPSIIGGLFIGSGGGTGTVALSGGADLTVGTYISLGTSSSSQGTMTVRGLGTTVTGTSNLSALNIGGHSTPQGKGTFIVADGASVDLAGQVKVYANGLLQLGEGAAAGTFSAASLDLAGELRFDHTGSLGFDTPLSGSGAINKYGSGTTTLTGSSDAFTGTTTVHAGKLVVGTSSTDALASSISVLSGATLGGIGTLGSTTILAAGLHTPGNSIGTAIIDGDYANAGTLEIEVSSADGGGGYGASDRLEVTGGVDVSGGTLRIVPVSGATWTEGQTYDYLVIDNQGAGDVTGSFTVQNLAFFSSNVIYNGGDGNDVLLALTRTDAGFELLGTTRNQRATAGGINALPDGSPLVAALQFLTVDEVDPTLDQLSGEIHAAIAGFVLDQSRVPRQAALDRTGSAMAGTTDGRQLWGTMLGSVGRLDAGNAGPVASTTVGLIGGADAWLTDNLFLGAEFGFTQSALTSRDRGSSAELQGVHLGVYGGARLDPLRLRFGGAVSLASVSVERTPDVVGLTDTLSSGYSAMTTQLFGELGYPLALDQVELEPFVGLALVTSSTGRYDETGGIAALSGEAASLNAAVASLGLRASTAFDLDGRPAKAFASAALESGPGLTPTATHGFAGGSDFTVAGAASGLHLQLGAGISAALSDDLDLDLTYHGTLGPDATGGALSITLSGRF